MSIETPTLAEVIQNGVKAELINLHTCLPAEVTEVEAGKVSVQPLLKRKFTDGTVVDLPIVTNVPIMYPRSGNFVLSFPVKAGDTGALIFSERSLDKWLVSGGSVDPDDVRRHDLSDGIFFPGLYPFSDAPEYDETKMTMKLGDTILTMSEEGKFTMTNGTNELIDLLVQVLDGILAATTNTMLGPQPWINLATFTTIKTKLETLKE